MVLSDELIAVVKRGDLAALEEHMSATRSVRAQARAQGLDPSVYVAPPLKALRFQRASTAATGAAPASGIEVTERCSPDDFTAANWLRIVNRAIVAANSLRVETGQQSAANRGTASDGGILAHATSAANFGAPAASFSLSNSDRPTREDRNASYMHRLAWDTFPWSREMDHHLRNTFRIQSFRENQKEVINATMSGDDVMVLMRTGGGKSEFSLACQKIPMSGCNCPEPKILILVTLLLSG